MQDFLDAIFVGRPLGRWLTALAWVLGGLLVGWFLSWFSQVVLKRVAAKTPTRIDDIILAFVEKPLVFIVALAGLRFGADTLILPGRMGEWIDRGYTILAIFAGAYALVRVVDSIIAEYLLPLAERTESRIDDHFVPVVRKLANALIWVAAFLIAFTEAGYDVGAILAGLGIGGVAVALAAKDTLSNFFGSVAVFIDRPFRINDRIKVSGFDGTVVDIGLRTSRLLTLDGRVVTMPNSTFSSNPIENVSSEPTSKIAASLDLDHGAGSAAIDRAILAVRKALNEIPSLDGKADAGVSAFSDIGVRLSYVFYVKKDAPWMQTVSAGHLAVLRAVEAEGIRIASRAIRDPARP